MKWNPLIIEELLASGLSQARIAEICETGQSHISALHLGKRKVPNWELGERLVALHAERCLRSAKEPPPPSRPRPLPTLNGQWATPTAEPAMTAARAQTAACGVSAGSEHTEQEAASCRG